MPPETRVIMLSSVALWLEFPIQGLMHNYLIVYIPLIAEQKKHISQSPVSTSFLDPGTLLTDPVFCSSIP